MSQAPSEPAVSAKPVTGRILITGGTGFVGSNIVKALGDRPIRLLVRDKAKAGKRSPSPNIELFEGDVTKPESLRGAMNGCEATIHLVAIIEESKKATFDGVIRGGTANVVAEARRIGLRRLIHMSAMGAINNPSYPYLKAKWDAEQAVMDSGTAWTIFRPSVIFGPGDGFINVLANLVRKAPIVPVAGSGNNKFQPVAVSDVAQSFVRALEEPKTAGRTFELGGPDTLSYEELIDLIAATLDKKRIKVHVPVGLMKPIVKISKPLPKAIRPPVTEEQIRMLSLDNSSLNSSTTRLIGRQPLRLRDNMGYIVKK